MEAKASADLYIVGLDSNVSGDEALAFQERLRKLGIQFDAPPEAEQVTVAKQRTMFQTQVSCFKRHIFFRLQIVDDAAC